MNIIYYLIGQFLQNEKFKVIFIIAISLLINFFKINVISLITANIIKTIQEKNFDNTNKYFYYFIIVFVLYILLNTFYKYFQVKVLTKLRYWIRNEIIKFLLVINNDKYSEINFTKLNSPIFRVSNTCFYVFNMIITTLVPNLTLLMIVSLYFIYKNFKIGTIFFIGNILVLFYLYNIWDNIISQNRNYENNISESESYVVEILNNIDKIIFRGNIQDEIDTHGEKCDKTVSSAVSFYSVANYHVLCMSIIVCITIIISLYYLINQYYEGKMDATLFITFFTILLLYRDLVLGAIQQIPDLIEFMGKKDSLVNIFNDMNENYMEVINKEYDEHNLDFNEIQFIDINFKYKNSSHYILNNFNLKLDTNNKIIGIVGLSGNGKSTFAKLLIKLYKYDGKILIDGTDVQNVDTVYLRENIIFVNQNSKLFDKKIIDNIMYGCNNPNKCHEHLKVIMQYKKIRELFKNIDLYNKKAGLAGENLSGGQRQIINIINGLITPSNIVILDEPTNGLDIELKRDLIEVIKYFKTFKKCIIIISHDDDIFPIFNETIKIDDKKIDTSSKISTSI